MTTTRTGRTTVFEQRPAAQQTNANDDGDDQVGAGLQQASQAAEREEGDPQAARRGESGNVGQDGQREEQRDGVREEPDRQQAMLAAIQQLTMALGTQQTAAVGQDRAREAPSTETATIMAGIQQLAAMQCDSGTYAELGPSTQ
ncbi:hypothetical protein PF004_g16532 [Phytophthora fragariae]|uniref:Uncharacterized protein n=1 Tax=Phytophthora fragariae TaxID=53985 RepID=A0A6G0NI42_9STRA|nr:hypothetical protein PF004_g16532 [Phytophthora fragariae]